jgi:xyloglucan-specific endo-beta-1,4-glucanase
MKLSVAPLVFLALAVPALAIPVRDVSVQGPRSSLEERATTYCGQWDTTTIGPYTFYTNLWGKDSATSGSQCSTIDSISGNTVNWSTSWTWQGGNYQVKSYSEMVILPKRTISSIGTIPSVWNWTYTGTNMVCNVAYDIWLGPQSTGSSSYEIMIWLAAIGGAGPISSTGSPIATITIANTSWRLFKGQNGSFTVFSFVAVNQVNNFNANLKLFLNYLTSSQGVSSSLYVQGIDAGTEPFVGSNAKLTNSFSVSTT